MEEKINQVFNAQQAYKYTLRKSNAVERIEKLMALKKTIERHESRIYDALKSDLRKCHFETAVSELYFVYAELDFAIKNISRWIRPKFVGKTLSSPFAKNRLYYEPKGVCLIISPWNYPFQLTLCPLISAIAAGNCVSVKPSELSTASSTVINSIITDTFEPKEVACFEGNEQVAQDLLALPFDHIFFTGSTAVGKLVMTAAAKNLSSVTLELGGKSPVIIDEEVNLQEAAEKIAWGKLVNSGQSCIAPDYVFVNRHRLGEFIAAYKIAVNNMFLTADNNPDPDVYGKIINEAHFNRLKQGVDEALNEGATIAFGGEFDAAELTIAPMVLTGVKAQCKLLTEEIFGPVLPVLAYDNLKEVIDELNTKGKPLALYFFSNNRSNIKSILKRTTAGGSCINDVLVHISNPKLPFGGINGSGMGSCHGFFGFKAFSHERAVVFQSKLNFNSLIYPPYRGKGWVLNILKRVM